MLRLFVDVKGFCLVCLVVWSLFWELVFFVDGKFEGFDCVICFVELIDFGM